jgi:hypothetical protein
VFVCVVGEGGRGWREDSFVWYVFAIKYADMFVSCICIT